MTHGAVRRCRTRTNVIGIVAILSIVAGCAGDGGDESAAGPTPAAAGSVAPVAPESGDESGDTDAESTVPPPQSTEAPASDTTVVTTDAATAPPVEQSTGEVLASGTVPPPVPGPTVTSEIDEPADFGTGIIATIDEIAAVDVEGRIPGERSGPGVMVSVRVENQSSAPITLDFTTVDLIGLDGASAIPVEMEESIRLEGELAPGASAVGRYHYFIPVEQRASATITISYAAGVPTALFTGALPDA